MATRLPKCIHLSSSPSSFQPDIIFLKHDCSIFRQSFNPVCGFSMMKQVRLWTVLPMENWLGFSMNHIQGWMNVWICYWHHHHIECLVLYSWFLVLFGLHIVVWRIICPLISLGVLSVTLYKSRHIFHSLRIGQWAATVATYCPSRLTELPKSSSSKPHNR